MKIYKTYKDIETWANAMRKDKSKKLFTDWVKIGGDWYTCEEYDESGRYMRYTSVTAWKHLDLDTSNRYSDIWLSDLVVTDYPIEDLRFDISYYLGYKAKREQLKCLATRLYDNQMYKEMRDLIDFLLK